MHLWRSIIRLLVDWVLSEELIRTRGVSLLRRRQTPTHATWLNMVAVFNNLPGNFRLPRGVVRFAE